MQGLGCQKVSQGRHMGSSLNQGPFQGPYEKGAVLLILGS